MDYQNYLNNKKQAVEDLKKVAEELKTCANEFFNTKGGRKYANQMLTAVKYFDALSNLKEDDLRYLQAQRDFVNVFLIGLIDKETLINIIKDR